MKRLARRTISLIILVVLFLSGFGIYTVRYIVNGKEWAAFRPNLHAYSYGILIKGSIVDRNGQILTYAKDGERFYNESTDIRKATLHVVGDTQGNIGTGLLSAYDSELMGYDLLGGLYTVSGNGNVVHATIDADLCATALRALGYRSGTVVVYNYVKGDILCMVSTPGFDPLSPPTVEEAEGNERYDGVYINRALTSVFAPGSIFKLITLEAAMETLPDVWDMQFTCNGSIDVAGDIISCNDIHGTIGIRDALARSCNVAFSELALRIGGKVLHDYAQKAGLIDAFTCSKIPVSAGQYQTASEGTADLAWSGIGQYNDLVNPLAAARYVGAIANHGTTAAPRIVSSITNQSGFPVRLLFKDGRRQLVKAETADIMKEMMMYNVSSWYGEGRFWGLSIGAKSGTAETAEGKTPHAWFVGFLDNPEQPLAFAVFVENGGWGLTVAGEIANTVLQQVK